MADLSAFCTEVKLLCQSPIIHFDYKAGGATLRATEVKPKLDKFLKRKLAEKGENPKPEWFVKNSGRATEAFDYKLRFDVQGDTEYFHQRPHDLYYGNMGTGGNKKQALWGDCTMTVICFHAELKKLIDEHITEFFVVTNFGTMQGKGFGSFVPSTLDLADRNTKQQIADWLCAASGSECCYNIFGYSDGTKWDRKERCNIEWSKTDFMLDDIKTLYSVMKSGCNNRDYMRSYLFKYFHNEVKIDGPDSQKIGVGNEKALMKKKRTSPVVAKPENADKGEQYRFTAEEEKYYRYVRAMLGIGERIEYFSEDPNRMYPGREVYEPLYVERRGRMVPDKTGVTIAHKPNKDKGESKIERLASPIFFKIIGSDIYFVANRINEKIYGKTFEFASRGRPITTVTTPTKDEFDIDDFLSWFVREYNNERKKYEEMSANQGGRPITKKYLIRKHINSIPQPQERK